MALLEREAQRFAEALDDYENVSVADMGGCDESGLWVVVHDHRFDHRYLINSYSDYWDFITRSSFGRCDLAGKDARGGLAIPREYHDPALPRPTREGLFGTIFCERCRFFGMGYNHPESCRWEWLKESHQLQHHLDIVELGGRIADLLGAKGASLV